MRPCPTFQWLKETLKAIAYYVRANALFLEYLPNQKGLQANLLTLGGQILCKEVLASGGAAKMDLAGLPAGIYLLRLSSNKAQVTFKIFKP